MKEEAGQATDLDWRPTLAGAIFARQQPFA